MTEYGQGVYYHNFTVPNPTGVYSYYTDCYIEDRKYYGLDTFHVYDLNESAISSNVWNATNRNLTYYPPTTDAQGIWEYSTRELTYYPTVNITLSNDSATAIAGAVWDYTGTPSQSLITSFTNPIICEIKKLWYQINPEWGVYIC
jgi:hypothetical protein